MQMPKGVPVATVAIGNAANAGLLALRILACSDSALQEKMLQYQVRAMSLTMQYFAIRPSDAVLQCLPLAFVLLVHGTVNMALPHYKPDLGKFALQDCDL